MDCPYCSKPMQNGVIYQTSVYGIKWIPKEKAKGFMLSPVTKGMYLTDLSGTGELEANYCPNCKKIIIDVK